MQPNTRAASQSVTIMVLSILTAVIAVNANASAAEPREAAPQAQAGSTIVLNTYGIWRFHCTLGPPVLVSGETVELRHVWLNYKTPGPPQDWMDPDFDDGFWDRGPAPLAVKSALVSKLCLRGKFTVTDPLAVRGLSLSVAYRGGLIVYVNGKEVHREHVAPGQTLAEGPAAAERDLTDLPIPADLARRCEDYLHNRHMLMWLSLSDLQLFYDHPGAKWGPRYLAAAWRGMPNNGGSHWFLSSGWQLRTEQLYALAGEVASQLGEQ